MRMLLIRISLPLLSISLLRLRCIVRAVVRRGGGPSPVYVVASDSSGLSRLGGLAGYRLARCSLRSLAGSLAWMAMAMAARGRPSVACVMDGFASRGRSRQIITAQIAEFVSRIVHSALLLALDVRWAKARRDTN